MEQKSKRQLPVLPSPLSYNWLSFTRDFRIQYHFEIHVDVASLLLKVGAVSGTAFMQGELEQIKNACGWGHKPVIFFQSTESSSALGISYRSSLNYNQYATSTLPDWPYLEYVAACWWSIPVPPLRKQNI
jgi:hypothetical protein